jgi:hypothetical protein
VPALAGPSLQLWVTDQLWAGATVGRSFVLSTQSGSRDGWGFELRAGITLNQGSASTFHLSIDLTPGFYPREPYFDTTVRIRFTGLALLVGYQYL